MHSSTFWCVQLVVINVWLCANQVCANDNFNKLFKLRGSIAQCRASCLENFVVLPATRGYPIKFNYGGSGNNMDANNLGCTSETNWKCSMCWDYCESLAVFELTRSQMCADDICLEGCQQACKFMQNLHETSTSSSVTSTTSTTKTTETKIVSSSVLAEKLKLAEPKVTKTGVIISWTMSPAKLTYAVLGLTSFHNVHNIDTSVSAWEEIQQTTGHQLILPTDAKYDEILVASFDSNGLVQTDSKKLVFQLRKKRSVDDKTNSLNLQSSLTNSEFAFTIMVIMVLFVFVIVVKVSFCTRRKNEKSLAVWV